MSCNFLSAITVRRDKFQRQCVLFEIVTYCDSLDDTFKHVYIYLLVNSEITKYRMSVII